MRFPLFALLLLCIIQFASCDRVINLPQEFNFLAHDSSEAEVEVKGELICGLPADSFMLEDGLIAKNSFLSEILLKKGITMQEIDQVLNNSKSVFDVRKILPGKKYTMLLEKDSTARMSYFIYEHDQATSYVFSFKDSLNITQIIKPVTTEIKYAAGTITSSLWNAILDNGLPPQLAADLSDVFAWTVDFFGVTTGDNFKVVYEEKLIDGEPFKTGKILTAQFTSVGTTYTAIPFIQNDKESYFDVDGNSLQKAFLKAPLKFSRISSRYTSSRFHPVLKIRRAHYGVDYAAPAGTPVYSIGDGKVTSVSYDAGSGRIVKIKHNSTYSTAYMHLLRFEKGIVAGKTVKQGDVIGYVGSSGLSTGPHLDFRFYRNGSPVDPLKVIAPPSEPVFSENLEDFNKVKEVCLSLLDTF